LLACSELRICGGDERDNIEITASDKPTVMSVCRQSLHNGLFLREASYRTRLIRVQECSSFAVVSDSEQVDVLLTPDLGDRLLYVVYHSHYRQIP